MSYLEVNIKAQLANFSLAVEERIPLTGIVGLFGHSGAGKSTLLKTIAGLKTPAVGDISLADTKLLATKERLNIASKHRRIVGVFQQDSLFPHLNVRDNLRFGRKRLSSPTLDADKIIEQAGLTLLLDRKVTYLSGGERQKVALVQAILAEPKLLILDEPVTALDRQNKLAILQLIKLLHLTTQMPMLFVSHNISEHEFLCEQLYVMENGQIIERGEISGVVAQLTQEQRIVPQTVLKVEQTDLPEQKGLARQNGLMQLRTPNGLELYTLSGRIIFNQGSSVCSILASDISVCTSPPDHSSIVNQLSGIITHISVHQHQALLTVNCSGQEFFSAITSYSMSQLALTVNQPIYLQFKASALQQLAYQGD
ncbi:ATP-binding cassette domain-containing protein [Thalassotalea euphylliae]|uniref:ATP-binding cassette domain-containing protein n=1 Tax=Thalassotalea euphylliae TaxID=1655234 RepID=A0A3E0UD95_9GAMM|nr:ATP-binding cassette domain-containing protein [Thalassotalea euphylliae]REL34553.1 ATP-binding cassette domain-containing protein [Thalassotalea euphylliae]